MATGVHLGFLPEHDLIGKINKGLYKLDNLVLLLQIIIERQQYHQAWYCTCHLSNQTNWSLGRLIGTVRHCLLSIVDWPAGLKTMTSSPLFTGDGKLGIVVSWCWMRVEPVVCQKPQNHRDFHLLQLLGGQEDFLMVIKQTILYEDGPNDLFERYELRDKSCGYYCCYCVCEGWRCLRHVPGVPFGGGYTSHLYWRGMRWHASSIWRHNIYR